MALAKKVMKQGIVTRGIIFTQLPAQWFIPYYDTI